MSGRRQAMILFGRSIIAAASLLLLGGCYLSSERLIVDGVDIGIDAGTYVCRGKDIETIVVGKRRATTPSGVDTIYTVGRTDYRFVALRPGLWLAQGTESSAFSYSFVDFPDANTLRILTRDPKAGMALRALAERHRLQTEPAFAADDSDARLKGSAADIRTFLTAHEMTMLVESMRCSR